MMGMFGKSSALMAVLMVGACSSLSPSNVINAISPDPVAIVPPDTEMLDPIATPAPEPPEVRLVTAIENQGCYLTAENVDAVLLEAGLTQADVAEITPRLADAGRVEVAGSGSIKVLTESCA